MSSPSRIRLGVLSRTHGLNGELRCDLDSAAIPVIAAPTPVWVGFSESFAEPMILSGYRRGNDALLCRFEGIENQTTAQTLVDRAVFILQESVAYENPFADPSVIGYDVVNEEGDRLGTVTGLFRTPAHYVWTIEREGVEWMIPAIEPFVHELWNDRRIAVVRTIPGMIDQEPDDVDR